MRSDSCLNRSEGGVLHAANIAQHPAVWLCACIDRSDVADIFCDFTMHRPSDSISCVPSRSSVVAARICCQVPRKSIVTPMIQLRRVLVLFGVLTGLAGCGLAVDAVRDAAERKASVPTGTLVAGDGFTVRSPVDGLHVVRDKPRRGFLCLRFTTELMFFGAGSYNVFPFSLDTPAPTLRDAWLANALTFFTDQGRASYQILSEHTGTWHGQPTYFQAAYSRQSPNGGGAITYSCLIQHGSKYYWVVRSTGVLDNHSDTIQRARAQSEEQLPAFLDSLSFAIAPAA